MKRAVWDRARRGAFVPWPQIALVAAALATYWLPYAFVPLADLPLAVAIGTMYHNIQYFGFVWTFERRRARLLQGWGEALQVPQRLAARGAYARYFGLALALAYSLGLGILYDAVPRHVGVVIIYTITVSHYFVDGFVWRRAYNRHVVPTFAALAAERAIAPASRSSAVVCGRAVARRCPRGLLKEALSSCRRCLDRCSASRDWPKR